MRRLTLIPACAALFALALPGFGASASATSPGTSWPSETLTGTVTMVVPAENLVILKGPDNVPFDMRVTRTTRIRSGDRTMTLRDLNAIKDQSVSVTFKPTESGDIARTIRVTG